MLNTLEANARRNWGPWLDEVCPGMRQRLPAGPAAVVPPPVVGRSSPPVVEQQPSPVVGRSSSRQIPILEKHSADEDEDSSDESDADLSEVAVTTRATTTTTPLVPVILPTHLKRTNWLSLVNDEVRNPLWVAAQKEQHKPTVSDPTFTPLTVLIHFC
jgi:hypothetical protein